MSADSIVALVGLFMALFLVSSGQTFRAMPWRKRALLGAVWAAIIGIVAVIAARLTS